MKYFYSSINALAPGKEDVKNMTPNPATKELIGYLEEQGVETIFDRFEAQQPQCGFGLRGSCCRMCQWGPCRISPKSQLGICGRDMETIVIANLLRALASGMAAHGRHAHEVIMAVIAASDRKADIELKGKKRIMELAKKLKINAKDRTFQEVAKDVANVLLEDLGRLTDEPMRMLEAYAPLERKNAWKKLGILPRSASYETMESLHMTTLGGCSDWNALAIQELRSALAYCYGTLFAASLSTEILYDVPKPKTTIVNYGILKENHVNILIHGHSPVMAEKIIEKIITPEVQQLLKDHGAKGIVIGGLCCTGTELLARYGIPAVTNIMGQELVLGTGAVDAVIVDMQCVIPGMKIVADCFGTEVITTCNSNRIPGAVHIPFDPERLDTLNGDAMLVVKKAIEAFARRDHSKMYIPKHVTSAMVGWSIEGILKKFGGKYKLLRLLKNDTITGIATIVGCNTPKVSYESNHVNIATGLIKEGVLLTTTGCCSHALLNAGLCAPEFSQFASHGLREICEDLGIPPVFAVGSCVDNIRSLRLFIEIAGAAKSSLKEMPFMFVGPEPGNEKSVGQGATFLCHGISNLIGFPAPLPVILPEQKDQSGQLRWMGADKNPIIDFFNDSGLNEKVGAKVYTRTDPEIAVKTIMAHLRQKRKALGWT